MGGWIDGLMVVVVVVMLVVVVAMAWVGFSVRAAAPCRTRTTHPDVGGVATAFAIAGEKRARGKYGRAVAARRSARRFGKLDSSTTDVIRFAALPLARRAGISGFLIENRRAANRRDLSSTSFFAPVNRTSLCNARRCSCDIRRRKIVRL